MLSIRLKDKKGKYYFLVLSLLIFIYYLRQNYFVSYYDESGYINVSRNILNLGLLNINEPLRTYFYPLIISCVSIFTNGNMEVIKTIMSVLQFVVYTYTILTIAEKTHLLIDSKVGYYLILGFGLLNPYLIQSTTLLLTDVLASCCIVLSLIKLVFGDFNKLLTYFWVIALAYIAVMIRPASLILVPIIIVLLIIRTLILKDVSILKACLISIISLIIFFPQLYNNVKQFDNWTPLVNTNLYEFQSNLATKNLKYGTVIINNEEPGMFFVSPHPVNESVKGMYDLIYKDFPGFLIVYSSHLFGVLDWGYVDTYITDYYPPSRVISSLFLYMYWITAFYGLYTIFRNKQPNKQQIYFIISFIGSFLFYWAFIGTTIIESRFGYPLFMLLLPFVGWGAKNAYNNIRSGTNSFNYKRCIQYVLICLIFMALALYISFLIDYQTGRINWLEFLMKRGG
ncbi:hypothetical protein [Paenibacillus sp. FSL R10-2771]|uniref:hypothetical protein n=1 Tax=Paenibacillus sp. FSL R10-2771 TaxID=2954693 RepID=UPI0030F4DCBE